MQKLGQKREQSVKKCGVGRFGIGAFFAPCNLIRQHILAGEAQKTFFAAFIVLIFPRSGIEIFRNAFVAEGNAHLKGGIHAAHILAGEKGLHEPIEIEGHHFAHTALKRGKVGQAVREGFGGVVFLHDVFLGIYHAGKFGGDEIFAVGCALCPRKALLFADVFIAVPRVAAENFVGTFTGKGDGDALFYLAAEKEHRRIDVSHAGIAAGVDRVKESGDEFGSIEDYLMMVAADMFYHEVDIVVIAVGLKVRGLEIFFVFAVENGECVERFALSFHFVGGDGGNDA